MLSLSPAKLLVLAVIALVVLGPEKLPQVARQLGAAWGELRRFRSRLETDVRGAFPDLPPAHEVARLIAPHIGVTTPEGADSRVKLGVDDFDWLAGYLIGLGLEFEVLEPVEMRAHLVALGRRLGRAHRPPAARAARAAVRPRH